MIRSLRLSKNSFIYLVLPWIVFSILYWATAYFKPFNMDEFFSWVYAEKCSFIEILSFKDGGIGHPPLFHVLQKIVQAAFPVYHPMQVRLVNYIAGSAFILLLTKVLRREGPVPGFFLGIASSACILNIFVFGRMWGLVCLTSLLLLWMGEKFICERTFRNTVWFAAIALFGFVSDYSFILLTPYMIMVIFSNTRYLDTIKRIGLWAIIFAGLLSVSILGTTKGWSYVGYFLLGSIPKLPFEAVNLLVNFWFMEPFLLSLLLFMFAYYLRWFKSSLQERAKWHRRHEVLGVGMLLVVMEAACRYFDFRVRYAGIIALLVIFLSYFRIRRSGKLFAHEDKNRLVAACAAGVVVLLILSPFMWRDLRAARFLIVLLPFVLVLIYKTLHKTALVTLSVILSVSGVLYLTSNGIGDYFPTKAFRNNYPIVYQSIFAYPDNYLRFGEAEGAQPYFTDSRPFATFCRVCKMGTDKIPYNEFSTLQVFTWSDQPLAIPSYFTCTKSEEYGLSWTDRFQFRYFSPIYPLHFSAYQCERDPLSSGINETRGKVIQVK
jgi:hypothetical protein